MKISNKEYLAHFIALTTIIIWSLTFVQTKVLLEYLTPIEILIDRFIIAWFLFFIIVPKVIFFSPKEELLFIFLGFTGIFGYYILENLALKYSKAINVGVIVTTAPIFTALILLFIKKAPKQKVIFTFLGFILVLVGLLIMDYQKFSTLNIGDLLALIGALSFGVYSFLLSKVDNRYNLFIVTRKSFFWGIIFLSIYFYITHQTFAPIEIYKKPLIWSNLLFLALIASGLCFLMWRYAVSIIGSSKTSNYIYLIPILNSLAAIYILGEKLDINTTIAMVLVLGGLFIAQKYGI
ncbi:MAG: DMT family transporter [Epsilonproteobacteria bacterium]|nr:DMT family transporter [Campylobacterota bacterium]